MKHKELVKKEIELPTLPDKTAPLIDALTSEK